MKTLQLWYQRLWISDKNYINLQIYDSSRQWRELLETNHLYQAYIKNNFSLDSLK